MLKRLFFLLVLAALAGGIWYFLKHYQVEGLQSLSVRDRAAQGDDASWDEAVPAPPPVPAERGKTVRIATCNLGPLDRHKLSRPHVAARLAELIGRFDLVAVQGFSAHNHGVVVELVEQVNSQGRHYDYAVRPDVGGESTSQFSAFLFDRATIEIDRSTIYPMRDPAGRVRRHPLVASFRARGPAPDEAFTFTLINVHVDPVQAELELDLLADVFRAVRDDDRNEDDVILLGDLAADEQHLGRLLEVPNITWAIAGIPTTTRGTRPVDNILFDRRATSEFTGRADVVDLMEEFEVSAREVMEISDHHPVWVEFSVYEGGHAAHVASGAKYPTR